MRNWISLGVCVSLVAACVLDREGKLSETSASAGAGPGGDGGGGAAPGGAGGGVAGMGGMAPICGDGITEGTETCDGDDLASMDCTDFAFSSPAGLSCNGTCDGFDTAGCSPTCDGVLLEATETCDGAFLDGQDCTVYGYVAPDGLACNGTCDDYDLAGCTAECDNGTMEPGEACDDANADPFDGCHQCVVTDGGCTAPYPVDMVLGQPPQTFVGATTGGADDATPTCPGVTTSPDHVWAVTPDADGFLSAWINPKNSDFDSVLYARTDCAVTADIRCADNFFPPPGGETLSFEVTGGTTYFIIVDGFDGDAGKYELNLDLSAGTCADPVEFPVFAGVGVCGLGSTVGKTNERLTAGCGGNQSGDVVYRMTANFTGSFSILINDANTDYDSVLTVDRDCGTDFTCNRQDGGDDVVGLVANVEGGVVYAWADGFAAAEGNYEICVNPP